MMNLSMLERTLFVPAKKIDLISGKFLPKPVEVDLLAEYRDRIVYYFGIIAFVFAIPVTAYNVKDGEIALSAITIAAIGALIVNSVSIHFRQKRIIPAPVFMTGLWLIVGFSFFRRGIYGLFWVFPIFLFLSFVVSHKSARIYSALFVIYTAVLAFRFVEFQTALRGMIGFVITVFFTHIFLNIIYTLRERLLAESVRDPLTGAFNRRQLMLTIQDLIERKHRGGETATLITIDIDHFKEVNDTVGHDAGDRVLQELAAVVDSRLRKLDKLFRLGGEEFLIALPLTSETEAVRLADELRTMTNSRIVAADRFITVSVGVCELAKGEDETSWLKRADNALYAAKRNGRNRVVIAESL